jgi:hypothetical protein
MATLGEVRSKETKMTSLESHKKMPVKKLPIEHIINTQISVITDPIDPKRISKEFTNNVTMSSAIKAGLVFFATVGSYYLAKTTGIFSYFGWGAKNSKDVGSKEIVSAKRSLSVRTNLETIRQANDPLVNQITQTHKGEDNTVKFEEIKIEEFKDLQETEKEDVEMQRSSFRRSINIQNPISDQYVLLGELFSLTINGTNVFNSSDYLFLEAQDIPSWLTSSNPNPTFKGSYDTSGNAYKIALSGNYAYVADNVSGLQIIDITNLTNPTFKSSYWAANFHPRGITVSENYAYLANAAHSGLWIIDISDPSNPTFKGSYDTPENALGVAVFENYAYVAATGSGLYLIDISNSSNPTFKGSYDTPGTAYKVALSDNYAYVADVSRSLQIIDTTNITNPTFKGSYWTPGFHAYGITISDNYAYVVGMPDLRIVDVRNPSTPVFMSSYNIPGYAYDITVSGNYAYIAGDEVGLKIIDISNTSNPTFKSSYDMPDSAYGIALSGNYVYVAAYGSGLQIIESNLDKLILSGTPNIVGTYGVNIKGYDGKKEYAIDSFDIHVINNSPIVSNPLQNQTAIVNTLFTYTFSNDTFTDPDGHSLDNSPLPNWLNFEPPQRKFSGTPTTLTTYPIKVIANDGFDDVSNAFSIHVINNSPIVSNPLKNQTAIVNNLFTYTFLNDTFTDPDGG